MMGLIVEHFIAIINGDTKSIQMIQKKQLLIAK